MTEDALVAALRTLVSHGGQRRLRLGIGDDAAVWQPSRSHHSVITTDALVEGVHFRRDLMSAQDVGHRALAANLSDIAAMGARPVLATVALGVTPDSDEAWIAACYRGMAALAQRSGATIAGGDISRASAIFLALTVVGEVRPTHCKTRGGARPGDVIALTGPLGASRAGLEILLAHEQWRDAAEMQAALRAYRTPEPRLAEGLWLGSSRSVHALMDTSDGLSTDLPRMCAASGLGALLETLPFADAAVALCAKTHADPAAYALHGGEDFELLAAVDRRAFGHLAARFERRFSKPLLAIGHFTEGSGVRMQNGAETLEVASAGWDHLRG